MHFLLPGVCPPACRLDIFDTRGPHGCRMGARQRCTLTLPTFPSPPKGAVKRSTACSNRAARHHATAFALPEPLARERGALSMSTLPLTASLATVCQALFPPLRKVLYFLFSHTISHSNPPLSLYPPRARRGIGGY